ncbi:hypothetical protein PybrP1_001269, partial [[Pythium] brassicae (nom. inval.)]
MPTNSGSCVSAVAKRASTTISRTKTTHDNRQERLGKPRKPGCGTTSMNIHRFPNACACDACYPLFRSLTYQLRFHPSHRLARMGKNIADELEQARYPRMFMASNHLSVIELKRNVDVGDTDAFRLMLHSAKRARAENAAAGAKNSSWRSEAKLSRSTADMLQLIMFVWEEADRKIEIRHDEEQERRREE